MSVCFRHAGGEQWRVWQSGWAGDQFETMNSDKMKNIIEFCRMLGFNLYFFPLNANSIDEAKPVGWHYNDRDFDLSKYEV